MCVRTCRLSARRCNRAEASAPSSASPQAPPPAPAPLHPLHRCAVPMHACVGVGAGVHVYVGVVVGRHGGLNRLQGSFPSSAQDAATTGAHTRSVSSGRSNPWYSTLGVFCQDAGTTDTYTPEVFSQDTGNLHPLTCTYTHILGVCCQDAGSSST